MDGKMNIVILLLVTVITKGDSYVINTKESKTEESVLLRKLQNFQKQSDQEITQTRTWNEMLAEVIINRIKLFTFHKENEQNIESPERPIPNFFTKTLSYMLKIYKTQVYDRWKKDIGVDYISQTNEVSDEPREVPNTPKEVSDEPKEVINPKEDVEIIEPKYHGKLCDNCTETPVEVTCPEGFQIDDKGDCVDSKASKLIISIPHQCPIGYRRDWFGFCRVRF